MSFPVFWTRLVLFVDESPTPLSDIQRYLDITHNSDLPLEVTVMRRDGTSTMHSDPNERSRVQAVMALLAPHVHRFRTLRFDVWQRSSLPLIDRDFHGEAPLLEDLKLNCRVDDGNDTDEISIASEGREEFSCPRLKELGVDGRNFGWFCKEDSERVNNLVSLKRLMISHFTPSKRNYGEALPITGLHDVMAVAPRLIYLQVNNVEFTSDGVDMDELQDFSSFGSVSLEDLSDGVVDMVVQLIHQVESLTITRCSLNAISRIQTSFYLNLNEISPTEDLVGYISVWDNNSLNVESCPGFNDDVLRALHTKCERLRNLHITDCNNFSIATLKEFVQARKGVMPPTPMEAIFEEYGPMQSLSYSSSPGPSISVEDEAWFKQNIQLAFGWYAVQSEDDTSAM